MKIRFAASLLLTFAAGTGAVAQTAVPSVAKIAPVTPGSVIAKAPAAAWKTIAPEDLLIVILRGSSSAAPRRVTIQLAPRFSQAHVANLRALAAAHWWDGTGVYRVQDDYVAQWGDVSENKALPPGLPTALAEDYDEAYADSLALAELPSRDSYTHLTGFLDGWPVATDHDRVWMPHCYGMVGVARNLAPDSGTGAELYAVIGHAPRQLDRNIALVGRVIEGVDLLSSLPRGHGALGFYAKDQVATPIISVRLASDLPEAERPRFQMMDTASASFGALMEIRANRQDDFYKVAAGGVDVCNVPVPVRRTH